MLCDYLARKSHPYLSLETIASRMSFKRFGAVQLIFLPYLKYVRAGNENISFTVKVMRLADCWRHLKKGIAVTTQIFQNKRLCLLLFIGFHRVKFMPRKNATGLFSPPVSESHAGRVLLIPPNMEGNVDCCSRGCSSESSIRCQLLWLMAAFMLNRIN